MKFLPLFLVSSVCCQVMTGVEVLLPCLLLEPGE